MEGHRGSGGNGYASDEVMEREEKGGVCGGVDTSREWKDGNK